MTLANTVLRRTTQLSGRVVQGRLLRDRALQLVRVPVRPPNRAGYCPSFLPVPRWVLSMVLPTLVVQVTSAQGLVPNSVWVRVNELIRLNGATNVTP